MAEDPNPIDEIGDQLPKLTFVANFLEWLNSAWWNIAILIAGLLLIIDIIIFVYRKRNNDDEASLFVLRFGGRIVVAIAKTIFNTIGRIFWAIVVQTLPYNLVVFAILAIVGWLVNGWGNPAWVDQHWAVNVFGGFFWEIGDGFIIIVNYVRDLIAEV